jgi:ABC-type thiamin/hydroxymethylpyrimidine transport system permease subunit
MRKRARVIGWLVFAVGLVFGLIGYVTDLYSGGTGTALMLGVWLVGAVLMALIPEREGIVTGKETSAHTPADVHQDLRWKDWSEGEWNGHSSTG